jgi:hypothetical protein
MLLNQGQLNRTRVLPASAVKLMSANLMQFLPVADTKALAVYRDFERAVDRAQRTSH